MAQAEIVAGVSCPGRVERRPRRGQLQLIALLRANSNNSNNTDHHSLRPDVRRRALIPTIGLKSAKSRRTHPKNPQSGN